MLRNLIYHVCPLIVNDLWLENVRQLIHRFDVFSGRKFIAVAVDGDTHTLDDVRDAFGKHANGTTFIKKTNDRRLREVGTFRALLELAEGPSGTTFYAHTKGNSTYDDVQGAIYWRNAMYHKLLDNWQECHAKLKEGFAAVGTTKRVWPKNFRSPYPSRLNHGNWMFAGTFFWFDNRQVFSQHNWRHVPNDRYGAEAWLAGMFEENQCHSVFQPWPQGKLGVNPYDPEMYIKAGCALSDAELDAPMYCI